MSAAALRAMRDLLQEDIGQRGLRTDPTHNLITACADDFAAACRSIADQPRPALAIVTGFYIPHATPPAAETDGPLGALFLARALTPLGIRVALITDAFCAQALQVGLAECGLQEQVPLLTIPPPTHPWDAYLRLDWQRFLTNTQLTHLLALERVGPSYTQDRCYTMRGLDITDRTAPAHRLFESIQQQRLPIVTLGIGDGGNEIGMGKVPPSIIQANIPNGGTIACRVATDYLIVSGISNWGAYGLAAGVCLLRGQPLTAELGDPERERALLAHMVEHGPLVDGVTGRQSISVDGIAFERYAAILVRLRAVNP